MSPLEPGAKHLLDQAWSLLDKSIQDHPGDIPLQIAAGWLHLKTADFERAGRLFVAARKTWKPLDDAGMTDCLLAGMAAEAQIQGRKDEAAARYKEQIETNTGLRWAEAKTVSNIHCKFIGALNQARALTLMRHPLLASVPSSFEFDYTAEPEPGLRAWRHVGGGKWEERYSIGTVSTFIVTGRNEVLHEKGLETGTYATKDDEPTMQVFIPDLNPIEGWFCFRTLDKTTGKWNTWARLAQVKNAR